MSELRDLLVRTANQIADYREGVAESRVFPDVDTAELRGAFAGPMLDGRDDVARRASHAYLGVELVDDRK